MKGGYLVVGKHLWGTRHVNCYHPLKLSKCLKVNAPVLWHHEKNLEFSHGIENLEKDANLNPLPHFWLLLESQISSTFIFFYFAQFWPKREGFRCCSQQFSIRSITILQFIECQKYICRQQKHYGSPIGVSNFYITAPKLLHLSYKWYFIIKIMDVSQIADATIKKNM